MHRKIEFCVFSSSIFIFQVLVNRIRILVKKCITFMWLAFYCICITVMASSRESERDQFWRVTSTSRLLQMYFLNIQAVLIVKIYLNIVALTYNSIYSNKEI